MSFILGVGAGLFAANVRTAAASGNGGGSLLKTGIKGAVLASARVRELVAHMKEAAEDAAAEAKAELGRTPEASRGNGEVASSGQSPQ